MSLGRFRRVTRALNEDERTLVTDIRDEAELLVQLFEHVKPGMYRALALIKLDEAVTYALKGIEEETPPEPKKAGPKPAAPPPAVPYNPMDPTTWDWI